jgi:hypothetical protein
MAIEKNIKINVNADQAIAELDKLESSLRDVEKESGKTSKSIDDVAGNGGAIAVLDGLTGGLATRFKDAYEATKLFNVSLKGMRTALIATGIGALVVGVGLLVAYFDEISDFISQTNTKLEQQNKLLEVGEKLESDKLTGLQLQRDLLVLQGKDTTGINKQIAQQLVILKDINAERLKTLKSDLAQLEAVEAQAAWWEKLLYFRSPHLRAQADQVAKDEAEIAKQNIRDEIQLLETKGIQIDLNAYKEANPITKAGEPQRQKEVQTNIEGGLTEQDLITLNSRELLNEKLKELGGDEIVEREKQLNVWNEMEMWWANLTAEQKLMKATATLNQLAGLVDQNSVAGKGIAVAQTGINTAQGIMQAFATLPTIPAIVASALVGATGLLQTQKIIKTKIPSASGRGFVGGGVGGAGGGSSAPSFNLVAGTASNQIASSVNQGTTPSRAYVVGSDVTTQQSMDRSIVSGSTL